MLLLVEIGLAFWARKRGWGKLAFMPIAFGLLAGLVLGFTVFAGMNPDTLMLAAFGIDGIVIASLVMMGAMGRQSDITPSKIQLGKTTKAMPYR